MLVEHVESGLGKGAAELDAVQVIVLCEAYQVLHEREAESLVPMLDVHHDVVNDHLPSGRQRRSHTAQGHAGRMTIDLNQDAERTRVRKNGRRVPLQVGCIRRKLAIQFFHSLSISGRGFPEAYVPMLVHLALDYTETSELSN